MKSQLDNGSVWVKKEITRREADTILCGFISLTYFSRVTISKKCSGIDFPYEKYFFEIFQNVKFISTCQLKRFDNEA